MSHLLEKKTKTKQKATTKKATTTLGNLATTRQTALTHLQEILKHSLESPKGEWNANPLLKNCFPLS